MKHLLTILLVLAVTVAVSAQVKTAKVKSPQVTAKTDTLKHSFEATIAFKKPTQARLTELQAKIEELQAIAKLLKKNDDILGIVNQRVGLLAREHQDQLKTLYESHGVDYTNILRDSVAGETLYLNFKKAEPAKK